MTDADTAIARAPLAINASGTFTDTNGPVELVSSLAPLFGLLSSNLLGA